MSPASSRHSCLPLLVIPASPSRHSCGGRNPEGRGSGASPPPATAGLPNHPHPPYRRTPVSRGAGHAIHQPLSISPAPSRHSCPPPRHSCGGRNPEGRGSGESPPPATSTHPNPPYRRRPVSRGAGHVVHQPLSISQPPHVIPAEAGIQRGGGAGRPHHQPQQPHPTTPTLHTGGGRYPGARGKPSTNPSRSSQPPHVIPSPQLVIPAKAGIQRGGEAGYAQSRDLHPSPHPDTSS